MPARLVVYEHYGPGQLPLGTPRFRRSQHTALSTEVDTCLKEMGGEAAGQLLIGASMTIGEYVLPQLIGKFKASYPAVMPTLFVGNSEAVFFFKQKTAYEITR